MTTKTCARPRPEIHSFSILLPPEFRCEGRLFLPRLIPPHSDSTAAPVHPGDRRTHVAAYLIEVAEEAAGILAAEARGFRINAASSDSFAHAGAFSATTRQAETAARAHLRKRAVRAILPARPN